MHRRIFISENLQRITQFSERWRLQQYAKEWKEMLFVENSQFAEYSCSSIEESIDQESIVTWLDLTIF